MPGPAVGATVLGVPTAAPALTIDERLALSPLAMDHRLDRAGLTFDVNTASIPVEAPEILTAPLPATTSRPTTAAEVLQEARRILADPDRGWCKKWLNDGVRACAWGAIREAAGGDNRLADDAAAVLLDRIRAEQPDTLSIGAWNDAQSGPGSVLRILGG